MAPKTRKFDSLAELLDESDRPIYAIDARRRIVYCNRALTEWLALDAAKIVGRQVEYHSESEPAAGAKADRVGILSTLCPSPAALAGQLGLGTISCMARDGRLVHRRADFIPLSPEFGGVLVLLAAADLQPFELAGQDDSEPTADELHRAIRRFRSEQAGRYSAASLLGDSTAMQKARAQAAAAAASGANVLIAGPQGSGRGHLARVIHYRAVADTTVRLLPIDCSHATDDLLRRTIDSLRGARGDARHRPTLLLENLDKLAAPYQNQLLDAIRQQTLTARIIATVPPAPENAGETDTTLLPALIDVVSTINIRLPRLRDRLEDLPLLAQSFIESCNRGNPKQVGSIRADALDLLALYSWPGELDELQAVIAAAHQAAPTQEITTRDLPDVIHHAAAAANSTRRRPEPIVLDELLAEIESELIKRALTLARGNKSEAATLLGMTRPRLYRRLVQLGLAGDNGAAPEDDGPEFIEQHTEDQQP